MNIILFKDHGSQIMSSEDEWDHNKTKTCPRKYRLCVWLLTSRLSFTTGVEGSESKPRLLANIDVEIDQHRTSSDYWAGSGRFVYIFHIFGLRNKDEKRPSQDDRRRIISHLGSICRIEVSPRLWRCLHSAASWYDCYFQFVCRKVVSLKFRVEGDLWLSPIGQST